MNLDLRLAPFNLPPLPRLVDLRSLQPLRARLEKRVQGELNAALHNRLEELRKRLRACAPRSGAVFNERFLQAADEIGRERLLLKLYLFDEGLPDVRRYLPPFDDTVCGYLMSEVNSVGVFGGLRSATALFFQYFDRLPALASLGQSLQAGFALASEEKLALGKAVRWSENRHWLFAPDGPYQLVARLKRGEALADAADRFGIPRGTDGVRAPRFFELALQHHLFARLKALRLGQDDEALFAELIAQRESPGPNRELIGTNTLQILIRRSLSENRGQLPPAWGSRIAALGCDPRLSRRAEGFRKWWSWANDAELAVALRWFTGEELDKFLVLLESSLGPTAAGMFERRKRLLMKLFDANKISDARLVLVEGALKDVRRHFREQLGYSFASLSSGQISIICLRVENFFLVEGTHSFKLRLYREFPVAGFWERTRTHFRIDEFKQRAIAEIPHLGDWELKFENALMQQPFRICWPEIQF